MSKFTKEQIKFLENNIIFGAVLASDVEPMIVRVKCGVAGDVRGSVAGDVTGSVDGNVGNVGGSVAGDVGGNVGGVGGSVAGGVGGDVGHVGGDVKGHVGGNVGGNVGNVGGNVGSVDGNVGNVGGSVLGSVLGNVRGDVKGHVDGNVGGSILGSVLGDVIGSVHGNVGGDVGGSVLNASTTGEKTEEMTTLSDIYEGAIDKEIVRQTTEALVKIIEVPQYFTNDYVGAAHNELNRRNQTTPPQPASTPASTPNEVVHDYLKEIKPDTFVDVYDVLKSFEVTCPAMAHAVKKSLMPGKRGSKDSLKDKREAIASIQRSIEIETMWQDHNNDK